MSTGNQVLRNRSLIILGAAESVSNIGNWITMMAVFALIVFKGEGSVAQSSGIFIAGLVPILVFSPAAGWLTDRFDRKKLMIASQLLSGLAIAGLIFVENLFWIYTLLALQAVFIAIMLPARQSIIPHLVAPEGLPRANAFLQQLNGIVKIVAPMVAGFILTVLNPHQAIILDVISFGFAALILGWLPALPRLSAESGRPAGAPSAPQDPAQAHSLLEILRRLPALQLLLAATFAAITVIIGFDVLSPIFIRDVLAGGERMFGFMVSLIGAGTLAATLLVMLRRKESNSWRDLLLGLALLACIPATMALAAFQSNPQVAAWLSMAGCLVGGFGNGLLVIQSATLLQRLSPPALLGRVGGIYQSTTVGGQLVGMLVIPLLVPVWLSIGSFFLAAALLLGLLCLATLFFLHRMNLMGRFTTRPAASSAD